MLHNGLIIACADLSERQELMRMLERRGYLWEAEQRPTEWHFDVDPEWLYIYIHRGKKITRSMEGNVDSITFQEVKDGLTRNRQTQRTSS